MIASINMCGLQLPSPEYINSYFLSFSSFVSTLMPLLRHSLCYNEKYHNGNVQTSTIEGVTLASPLSQLASSNTAKNNYFWECDRGYSTVPRPLL